MSSKALVGLLQYISNTNLVITKDVSSFLKKDDRYAQAYMDALEDADLVMWERKGQMKMFRLTKKGEKRLNGSK